MYTVQGYIGGTAYGVAVGADAVDTAEDGERAGIVVGSPNAVGLLQAAVGGDHRPTPTTAADRLSLDDGAAILAALMALTEVTAVSGDSPDLTEGDVPQVGVTY
jgi:hypothetical protein